jgi:hypothetical protein
MWIWHFWAVVNDVMPLNPDHGTALDCGVTLTSTSSMNWGIAV